MTYHEAFQQLRTEALQYQGVWSHRAEEYANAGDLAGFKDATRKAYSLSLFLRKLRDEYTKWAHLAGNTEADFLVGLCPPH